MNSLFKKISKFWCKNKIHPNGKLIGIADRIEIDCKLNKEPDIIRGNWILRGCSFCGDTYADELIGFNKVPVNCSGAMMFMEKCINGCQHERLYIRTNKNGIVAVGCNGCRRAVSSNNIAEALNRWEESN